MDPTLLAVSIILLVFSVILHEVMHGLVALKFGDHTAENAGRLTLNPIPHIDLVGTILLPLASILLHSGFLIGWAKPVPVNPLNFRDIRKGELAVSLAGIGANFALVIIFAILYHLTYNLGNRFLTEIFVTGVGINLMLGVFNLIPIPPLDGSKVLISLLPYHLARQLESIGAYGFMILFLLIYLGILNLVVSLIIYPIITLLGIR